MLPFALQLRQNLRTYSAENVACGSREDLPHCKHSFCRRNCVELFTLKANIFAALMCVSEPGFISRPFCRLSSFHIHTSSVSPEQTCPQRDVIRELRFKMQPFYTGRNDDFLIPKKCGMLILSLSSFQTVSMSQRYYLILSTTSKVVISSPSYED